MRMQLIELTLCGDDEGQARQHDGARKVALARPVYAPAQCQALAKHPGRHTAPHWLSVARRRRGVARFSLPSRSDWDPSSLVAAGQSASVTSSDRTIQVLLPSHQPRF
jgi:hypothetical protein